MKYSPSLITSAIFISLLANSVEASNDEHNMETIVVSGTKTAKLLSDSPVSVDVVEGSTINLITKGTLADVLEYLPGVLVTRSTKDGYNVSMRGFDSKHVLILVNGQPLAAPANSSVDLDQISATDIAQVEIMRGAASVMYGSAAMGGVINIITNRDDEDKAILTYELGSYGDNAIDGEELSHLYKVNLGKEIADWYHSLKLHKVDEAGFDLVQSDLASDAVEDAASIEKQFVNYSAFSQLGHVNTNLAYQYFDEYKEKITSVLQGRLFTYSSDVEQHQLDVNLHDIVNEWKFNGRYIEHNEVSGQSGSLRDAEIKLAEIDGMKVWQSGVVSPTSPGQSGTEIVAGFLTHYDYLNQFKLATTSAEKKIEVDDKSRRSIEAYAQFNYYTSEYQVLAGLRTQDDSDFGNHTALQVDGMLDYEFNDYSVQVRFGYGQGYRVPDLKERHYIFDHSNLGYMVIGGEVALGDVFDDEYFQNPEFNGDAMLPEESDTISASVDLRTSLFNNSADYNFSFSTHASETENLIITVEDAKATIATGLDISRYSNISEASIRGVDISNEVNFNEWTLALDYSFLYREDEDGERLTGKPKHQVKARLAYEFTDLDITTLLFVTYQADEAIPDSYVGEVVDNYSLVDFKFNQRINEHLDWHFSLNNIFDEHQSSAAVKRGEFDPRPVSSQEIRIGATYKF